MGHKQAEHRRVRFWTRREFVKAGLMAPPLLSLSGTVPAFLRCVAAQENQRPDRILVVVQLSGGNDGLNTVIPYRDSLYYENRATLAIPASDVIKINDSLGLHPSMRAAADLWEQGRMAIVQGVGYPQPNRSHFESMDIWHTCYGKTRTRQDGWLGRYLERHQSATELAGMHLGHEPLPMALTSRQAQVLSVSSMQEFRLRAKRSQVEQVERLAAATRAQDDTLLEFLQSSTQAALHASSRLERLVQEGMGQQQGFPRTALGEKLATVARLIRAELPTRVYYVALDGFDTHAQQPAAHAGLLDQWTTAVKAFFDDLQSAGHAERVLLFSFSEFGRRVRENASQGTDHGAAAPVFLFGPAVEPGVHGQHPRLDDLDDGDLKFHTDFRRVYATLLERWFGLAESASILGGPFAQLPVLRST